MNCETYISSYKGFDYMRCQAFIEDPRIGITVESCFQLYMYVCSSELEYMIKYELTIVRFFSACFYFIIIGGIIFIRFRKVVEFQSFRQMPQLGKLGLQKGLVLFSLILNLIISTC